MYTKSRKPSAKRAMRMCPRSGQIFYIGYPKKPGKKNLKPEKPGKIKEFLNLKIVVEIL